MFFVDTNSILEQISSRIFIQNTVLDFDTRPYFLVEDGAQLRLPVEYKFIYKNFSMVFVANKQALKKQLSNAPISTSLIVPYYEQNLFQKKIHYIKKDDDTWEMNVLSGQKVRSAYTSSQVAPDTSY